MIISSMEGWTHLKTCPPFGQTWHFFTLSDQFRTSVITLVQTPTRRTVPTRCPLHPDQYQPPLPNNKVHTWTWVAQIREHLRHANRGDTRMIDSQAEIWEASPKTLLISSKTCRLERLIICQLLQTQHLRITEHPQCLSTTLTRPIKKLETHRWETTLLERCAQVKQEGA